MDNEKNRFYYKGVLKFNSPNIPDASVPAVVHSLKTYLPALKEDVDNDRIYLDKLLYELKKETIDHNMFFHKSVPKQKDLNYHLVDGIWEFVKHWCKNNLKISVEKKCPISVLDRNEMGNNDATGLFCYKPHNRYCEIQILKSILDDTQYYLITLVHEYMHYIHYSLVSPFEFHKCPKIFSEGFSEYGCRIFYEQSGYNLQPHFRKSWNEWYEMGRIIVNQICSEGFGIYGFTNGFLRNIKSNNPWKSLDHFF